MTEILAGLATLALIAALATGVGAFAASRCGPIDRPNARSNHIDPRPRAGGLGLALGAGAAALGLALGAAPDLRAALGPDAARLGAILAVAGLGGLLGLLDDMSLIGLRGKFGGMGVVAVLAALGAGPALTLDSGVAALGIPWWAGLAGAALWVFVAGNTVNFMDGADGMMAAGLGAAGIGLMALGLLSGAMLAAVCGAILLGVLAGFAPFNAPRSRLFAGDGGAALAAILFACGALALGRQAPGALWLAPLLIAPFLADVFATLLGRARARAPLAEAHREHVYQLLLARGWTHGRAALLYGAAGLACVGAAALALRAGPLACCLLLAVAAPGGLAAAGLARRRLMS